MFNQQAIGTLGGTSSRPRGLGTQGEVVGFAHNSSGDARAFFFDANGILDLGLLPLAVSPLTLGFLLSVGEARAIGHSANGDTIVVGTSGLVPGPNALFSRVPIVPIEQAWFVNISSAVAAGTPPVLVGIGTLVPSPAPGVFLGSSHVRAINNKGQIVGVSDTTPTGGPRQAFLFDLSTGSMQNIGTFVRDPATGAFLGFSEALGINDKGEIVGVSDTGHVDANNAPIRQAFVHSMATGQMTNLGTLLARHIGPSVARGASEARAINDRGQIVGVSTSLEADRVTEVTRAFLFDPFLIGVPMMRDLGTFAAATRPGVFRDEGQSEAYAINAAGDIVGTADTALLDESGGRIRHAFRFVAASGQLEDLHAAAFINPGNVFGDAVGINDAGQMCGTVTASNGDTSGILLTP